MHFRNCYTEGVPNLDDVRKHILVFLDLAKAFDTVYIDAQTICGSANSALDCQCSSFETADNTK